MVFMYILTLDDDEFNNLMRTLKFNEERLDGYIAKRLSECCFENKRQASSGLVEIELSDKALTELIRQLLRNTSYFLEDLKLKEIKGSE